MWSVEYCDVGGAGLAGSVDDVYSAIARTEDVVDDGYIKVRAAYASAVVDADKAVSALVVGTYAGVVDGEESTVVWMLGVGGRRWGTSGAVISGSVVMSPSSVVSGTSVASAASSASGSPRYDFLWRPHAVCNRN